MRGVRHIADPVFGVVSGAKKGQLPQTNAPLRLKNAFIQDGPQRYLLVIYQKNTLSIIAYKHF